METEKRREIDGIENERESASKRAKESGNVGGEWRERRVFGVFEYVCVGYICVCICNTVHRTSRSRMEAEEREGGEG